MSVASFSANERFVKNIQKLSPQLRQVFYDDVSTALNNERNRVKPAEQMILLQFQNYIKAIVTQEMLPDVWFTTLYASYNTLPFFATFLKHFHLFFNLCKWWNKLWNLVEPMREIFIAESIKRLTDEIDKSSTTDIMLIKQLVDFLIQIKNPQNITQTTKNQYSNYFLIMHNSSFFQKFLSMLK